MIIGLSEEQQKIVDKKVGELTAQETQARAGLQQSGGAGMAAAAKINAEGPTAMSCNVLVSSSREVGRNDETLRRVNEALQKFSEISPDQVQHNIQVLDHAGGIYKAATEPAQKSCDTLKATAPSVVAPG